MLDPRLKPLMLDPKDDHSGEVSLFNRRGEPTATIGWDPGANITNRAV